MKDRQGECLGKISHPYRVWKVYKHRFSENTELAIGRTLNLPVHDACTHTCMAVSAYQYKYMHIIGKHTHTHTHNNKKKRVRLEYIPNCVDVSNRTQNLLV